MADNQRLGANFTIDVSDLKAGLAQANRMIRESESEFKAAAAGMDDWGSSADGLNARIKHLTTASDLQRKKVSALQKEYDRLVSGGMDEASKAAVELRTKINQEQAALNKTEKELKEQTEALKDLSDGSNKASKETEKLTDATKKSGKGFTVAKGAVAGFVANALTALISKAIEGAKAVIGLAESTRELRNDMAKLETGFTTSGFSAEDATQAYTTLYSVLGDEGKATKAAAHLAQLTDNQVDLSKWTDIATGIYATFGDSLPIEGLTKAANETAKTGKLTGVLTDALNWAGESEDAFQAKLDAANSEQERQALITSTLTGLYKEQSQSFKTLNKDVIAANRAQAELSLQMADIGAAMEPLNTKITVLKTAILSEFAPSIGGLIESINGMIDGTAGATEEFSARFTEIITTITEKITERLPQFTELAVQLISTLINGIVEQLPMIAETAVQIVTTLINGIAEMLPSLIPAIVDAVLLIVETIIDNLDKVIDAGIAIILALIDGLLEALPRLIDKIPVIIEKLVAAIINNLPKIVEAAIQIINALAMGLIQAIPQLVVKIPEIIFAIVQAFADNMGSIVDIGKNLIKGLWDGIASMATWIGEKIKGFGEGVLNGIKDFFGIHSPSTVFRDEIGKNLALGIGEGFEESMRGVNATISHTIDKTASTAGSVTNGADSAVASGRVINVTQNITYNKSESRADLFKTRQATKAAVRLAMAGG